MKIKITGSSGYLGKILLSELEENGHQVSGISRELLYGPIEKLSGEIRNSDVVINLAGSPILQRWTKKNKAVILESRVKTTQALVAAINGLPENERPEKFISASAIGIYKAGFQHDENSQNFDEGFVGQVVSQWEAASENLPPEVQRNIMRIGLVLGKNAKTIKNLILPIKLGLGATIGIGKQAFPFIHEKDVLKAFLWVIEKYNNNGIFNLVAPEKITNRYFTKAFAKALNRPVLLSIPKFMIQIILGEASVLLTHSAQVFPKNLLNNGFQFTFPTINDAMKEIT